MDKSANPVLSMEEVRFRRRDFCLSIQLTCSIWPLVILGPSGAGKTSVLRTLAGLDRPEGGRIQFSDEIWSCPEDKTWIPSHDRRLGLCFQQPQLFPHLSVFENVEFARKRGPKAVKGSPDDSSRLLKSLGLEDLALRSPEEISGGEQSRVALARAVVADPQLLLLDEPFASLDRPIRSEILDQAWPILRGADRPTVWVTHDLELARRLGGYLVVLLQGSIRESGPSAEVFSAPRDPEVAQFLSPAL